MMRSSMSVKRLLIYLQPKASWVTECGNVSSQILMSLEINLQECMHKGLVGAIGAIPGTVCAHPFDVVKIRMQTSRTSDPFRGGIRKAIKAVAAGLERPGTPGALQASQFFRGLAPAMQQKVITRAPMFLLAELCTQAYQTAGLSRTQACFVGCFCSGFITGSAAALPEYRKVLQSQCVCGEGTSTVQAVMRAAVASGQTGSILIRMRSAGLRNAIFDSIFFGAQHTLSSHLASGPSYACAAALAVTLDYSVDVVVKRMMVVPPQQALRPLMQSWLQLFRGHASVFHACASVHAGLSAKAVEFSVSYFITGTVGVSVAASLQQLYDSTCSPKNGTKRRCLQHSSDMCFLFLCISECIRGSPTAVGPPWFSVTLLEQEQRHVEIVDDAHPELEIA